MKRFLGLVFLVLVALVAQGNLKYFPTPYWRVDILLLIIIYLGFFVPFFSGVFWVIFLGFIQESWCLPFHGPLLLTYLIFYFFLRSFHKNLFFQESASQVLWVFVLSLVSRGILHIILVSFSYGASFSLISNIIFSVFQGIVSVFLFPLLNQLIREGNDPYAY